MKKLFVLFAFLCAALLGQAQVQNQKFMGIGMNCTISTFTSKLKGKGFEQDMNASRDNLVVMKGLFAGEKVKVEVRGAAKTHLVCSATVCFYMSTRYTYESLRTQLSDKYGMEYQEFLKVKEGEGVVPYTTDYIIWRTDKDPDNGACNQVVLSKCNYRSTAPLVISYIDSRNSAIDMQEIKSDF